MHKFEIEGGAPVPVPRKQVQTLLSNRFRKPAMFYDGPVPYSVAAAFLADLHQTLGSSDLVNRLDADENRFVRWMRHWITEQRPWIPEGYHASLALIRVIQFEERAAQDELKVRVTRGGVKILRTIISIEDAAASMLPAPTTVEDYTRRLGGLMLEGRELFGLRHNGKWTECRVDEDGDINGIILDFNKWIGCADAIEIDSPDWFCKKAFPSYERALEGTKIVDLGAPDIWSDMATFRNAKPESEWHYR